jgi:hypothetical protein
MRSSHTLLVECRRTSLRKEGGEVFFVEDGGQLGNFAGHRRRDPQQRDDVRQQNAALDVADVTL